MKRPIHELIDELNAAEEHPRLEAKTNFGESALETFVAFANEPGLGGGTVVLGVARNKSGRYVAVGVTNGDDTSEQIASSCADRTLNHPLRPTTWSEVVDDKLCVAAFVPEARPTEKPVYFSKRGLPKGALRRIGGSDVRCSDDDLRLFHQLAAERPYEDTLVIDATMDDLDSDVITSYRKALIEANPATEVRDLSLEELVQALGGARREDGRLRPTVAGVLLFAKPLALRRLFPFFRVDYIRVPGTAWAEDPAQPFETIDVRQPLLVAFRRIYQAILDGLPRAVAVREGSPERVESPTVPERVIREALVNALCHRDYRVHNPIQVIRYSNRIEFRNAGHSLVDEDALGEPGSETRNPRVADVFREMRLAENKGSGVRVMRREMENAKLARPLFDSDRAKNRFVATLLFSHLLSDEQRAWIVSLGDLALSQHEQMALVYCRQTGEVRNAALRDLTGLDTLAASAVLRELRDKGLLEVRSAGAHTFYVLAKPAAPAVERRDGDAQGWLFSDDTGGFLAKTGGLPAEGGVETGGLPAEGSVETGGLPGLAALPPELAARVKGLSKRPKEQELRDLIRDLCTLRAYRAAELAALLGRKKVRHLAEEHLAPMVTAGILERTIPENPSHPGQAFRTRSRG